MPQPQKGSIWISRRSGVRYRVTAVAGAFVYFEPEALPSERRDECGRAVCLEATMRVEAFVARYEPDAGQL
jgi:hypothetical protein